MLGRVDWNEHGELPAAARRLCHAVAALLGLAALVAWVVNVAETRFLCDDAYISYRYADHLARGLGLVWNAGERVEGYTNFLWVLLLAAGLRLGIAPEIASQALGIASGLALLGLVFLAGGRGPLGRLRGGAAALLLGAHGSFGAWSTSGLETMFFACLVWGATWRFLLERREPDQSRVVSGLGFALAVLTRPDGALHAGIAGLFLAFDLARRRVAPRAFAGWLVALGLPVSLHLAWRLAYYGDWLPNTFRAKVPGLWVGQGLHYLALYEVQYRPLFFLPLAYLALFGRRRSEAALIGSSLAATLVYLVLVGGDRFEFRFLIVVLPHITWLVVEGASVLASVASAPWTRRATGALSALALLALLTLTLLGYRANASDRRGNARVRVVQEYATRRAQEGRQLRDWIERGLLPRDLVLCVGGAGAVPYYTRWTTVDRHGLNDEWIARQPMAERGLVAHERDAPYEYLQRRRVAVFDYFNRLISSPELLDRRKPARYDGRRLALRGLEIEGKVLVFGTFLSDEELAALFPGREILGAGE
jgi:hypothetical protein